MLVSGNGHRPVSLPSFLPSFLPVRVLSMSSSKDGKKKRKEGGRQSDGGPPLSSSLPSPTFFSIAICEIEPSSFPLFPLLISRLSSFPEIHSQVVSLSLSLSLSLPKYAACLFFFFTRRERERESHFFLVRKREGERRKGREASWSRRLWK